MAVKTKPRKKAPPAILDLEDTIESINMLIYGDSGIGKTVFTGELNERLLILSTDTGGTTSARRMGSKAKLWHIKTWTDLLAAYEYLEDNPDAFDWVSIDTMTEMQTLCLRHILELAVKSNAQRNPDVPQIQDHQEYQNRFKRFVDLFNALPINTIWVAHVMTTEDDEGDDVKLPLLHGGKSWIKIARTTCAKMNVVGFMELREDDEEDVRRIYWQPKPEFFAKDRYACLGKFTDNIPFSRIEKRILAFAGGEPQEVAAPKKAAVKKAAAKKPRAKGIEPEGDDD